MAALSLSMGDVEPEKLIQCCHPGSKSSAAVTYHDKYATQHINQNYEYSLYSSYIIAQLYLIMTYYNHASGKFYLCCLIFTKLLWCNWNLVQSFKLPAKNNFNSLSDDTYFYLFYFVIVADTLGGNFSVTSIFYYWF